MGIGKYWVIIDFIIYYGNNGVFVCECFNMSLFVVRVICCVYGI